MDGWIVLIQTWGLAQIFLLWCSSDPCCLDVRLHSDVCLHVKFTGSDFTCRLHSPHVSDGSFWCWCMFLMVVELNDPFSWLASTQLHHMRWAVTSYIYSLQSKKSHHHSSFTEPYLLFLWILEEKMRYSNAMGRIRTVCLFVAFVTLIPKMDDKNNNICRLLHKTLRYMWGKKRQKWQPSLWSAHVQFYLSGWLRGKYWNKKNDKTTE